MSIDGTVEGISSTMKALSLGEVDLSEGEIKFVEHIFSEKFVVKLIASFQQASQFWKHLKLKTKMGNQDVEMPMAMGFLSIAQRISKYVNPLERNGGPGLDQNKFLFQLLHHFVQRLGEEDVHGDIQQNAHQKQIFCTLLLLYAFITYEKLVLIAKKNKTHDKKVVEEICSEIGLCANSTKFVIEYYTPTEDETFNNEFNKLHKELVRKLYILKCQFNPSYIGFKELQFHVSRKNKQSQENGGTYHGQVIFNLEVSNQLIIDPTVIDNLLEQFKKIRVGEQPRTQFIVDINGQGHANVLDVSFNKLSDKFEIISVEPARVTGQLYFLDALMQKLGNIPDIVAIQADLLKDTSNCYAFSLALSSQVAKLTFESLKKCKSIPTPDFMNDTQKNSFNIKNHIDWKPVTALGQKVVMMGQSQTDMKQRLKVLLPKESDKNIDKMISEHLALYCLDGPQILLPDEPADKKSYIHARRHNLRQRTKQDPYSDLSVEAILAKTKAKTPDQALRRLACGYGAKRWMEFLLEKHPESVDVPNSGGETALYWAYEKQKASRANLLIKKGAKKDNVKQKAKTSLVSK